MNLFKAAPAAVASKRSIRGLHFVGCSTLARFCSLPRPIKPVGRDRIQARQPYPALHVARRQQLQLGWIARRKRSIVVRISCFPIEILRLVWLCLTSGKKHIRFYIRPTRRFPANLGSVLALTFIRNAAIGIPLGARPLVAINKWILAH